MLTSHFDNCIECNIIVTPLLILPEWYLLCYYGVLKGMFDIDVGF